MAFFNDRLDRYILEISGASDIESQSIIQELWSGYGTLSRVHLIGSQESTLIIKHIHPPTASNHPRGWDTDISHQRKLRSYQVEKTWYQQWSHQCNEGSRVPECRGVAPSENDELLIVLEDLDASGFAERGSANSQPPVEVCLKWLAHFHAQFIHREPGDLWPIGTYWHLDTRPSEWQALPAEDPLKLAAHQIDRVLNQAKFQTLVHGDAKIANFCFSSDYQQVAAVDFQYIGGGCGIKDVAYLMGSCIAENQLTSREESLLNTYFSELQTALAIYQPQLDSDELITEWRAMFDLAWADFHRFLKGWCPGHWKLTDYSETVSRRAIEACS